MARRLLLADDSITIQKVVELVLAEEDFEIKSVGNGEEAFKSLSNFKPDIVLADIEMPGLNGYQLCEKIKKNPTTSGVPVILLAGAFEPIDEDLAKKVGADDSVIKPFESQELISKLNAALTISSAEAQGTAEAVGAEEDILQLVEDTDVGIEAEVAEAAALDEDLWSMEEMPEVAEELPAEALVAEESAAVEEIVEIPEEKTAMKFKEKAAETVVQQAVQRGVVVQEIAMPSKEELLKIVEKAVNEKVSALISSTDIKEALLSSLMPSMKDSLEKVLWEVAPDLVEKMLKDILKGSIASLTAQVEKVIWETVPDLAGNLISKEIEKIKSEL
jgi:DNA-binding response OmpR family regulator